MRFWLIHTTQGDTHAESLKEYEIAQECTVGRRQGDILLSDDLVSGKHAMFYVENNRLYIIDVGSSNGTKINGRKIPPNIAVELSHSDLVKVGKQFLKVKAEYLEEPDERTRIESAESTRIENLERTSFEGKESTHSKSIKVITDATQVEAHNAPIEVKIKSIDEEARPVLKIINNDNSQFHQTPSVIRDEEDKDEWKRRKRIQQDLRFEERALLEAQEKKLKEQHLLVEEIKNHLTSKKAILSISLIIGFFAFIFLNGKNSNETLNEEAAPQVTKKKIENKTQSSTRVATTQTESPLPSTTQTTTPVINDNNSSSNTLTTSEQSKVTQEGERTQTANTPENNAVTAPSTNPPKPTDTAPVKKLASTDSSNARNDFYLEEALLKKLSVIKKEMKRTKSYRVKYALETDANDLCALHYEKLREGIRAKWASSRGLASTQKQKLKATLQNQLVNMHQREKSVKSRLPSYLYGKSKNPFPNY